MPDDDDIEKSEHLAPEPSPVEAAILGALIVKVVSDLQGDREAGDLTDAIKSRYPALVKAAQVARMVAAELDVESSPETVRRRAAAVRKAQAAEEEQRQSMSRKLLARAEARRVRSDVEVARKSLARAQDELARIEKGGGEPRDLVLAEGACGMWQAKLSKAEEKLAALEREARDGEETTP